MTSRSVRVGALAWACVVLGACSIEKGERALARFEPPAYGTAVPVATWERLAESTENKGSDGHMWLLPFWIDGTATELSTLEDRLDHRVFSHLNMGVGLINLPWIPLWFSYDHRILERDGGQARNEVVWTPLYSSTDLDAWPDDEQRLMTGGIPLLYSSIEYGAVDKEPELHFLTTLWSIGPSYATFNGFEADESLDGWVFVPINGAGVGALVWTSAEIQADRFDVSTHGPLFGLLGWMSIEKGRREISMLLSGLLWFEKETRSSDGRVRDSVNGPLWGMFGWGRDQGELELRLLWIPIPLPGGRDS